MKAVESNFLKFLQQPKQFVIPIYQRTYSWEKAQCQQLWRDILRVGKDTDATGHFIGSIVYIASGILVISSVPELLVIDGQQRLTTLSLLIAAVAQAVAARGEDVGITAKKLENYYLFNSEEDGDLHYKLLLTRADKQTMMRLVEGKEPLEGEVSPRVVDTHRFFSDQIAPLNNADLRALWAGIGKLIIVDISLDREHDNPQLIFESLNATALKLTESDLIRNYVLMDLPPVDQIALYSEHWFPIEKGFANSNWFDWFVRDYLTVRTGAIPNVRDIYATFKNYVRGGGVGGTAIPVAEVVAEMHRYARYFVRLTQEDKEPDGDLHTAFTDLRTLEVNVARPFLLRLYEDYDKGMVDKKTMLVALRVIESYVFRRSVCGIATNTLNKTFAGLDREIRQDDYLNSLYAALMLKDSYRRFPDDEEFKREIVARDLYNFRTRNYLLAKLENDGSKEPVSVAAFTIEHILPQTPNLRPEWQSALGNDWQEVQARFLHTLGNLTLTGYNLEYSDRPFQEKRDMDGGFKQSPLRLNQGLGELDTWGVSEIGARAQKLAVKAAAIWMRPKLTEQVTATYKPPSLADDVDAATRAYFRQLLQGNTMVLFQELKKRIMNLDASVRMTLHKQFIGFGADGAETFVSVIPYQDGMRLILNLRLDELDDPHSVCQDISGNDHLGIGDSETELFNDVGQLDALLPLIRQAFEGQAEESIG